MDRNQGGTGQSSSAPNESVQTLDPVFGPPEGSGLPDDSRRVRTTEGAKEKLGGFLKAVGVRNDLHDFEVSATNLLLRLMEQTVLNIYWYDRRIKRGYVVYNIYLTFAMVLILSIPLLAAGVHWMIGRIGDLSWPGMLIAVFTSLLAAQGLVKQAYDQKFHFSAFWEARSKITTAYLNMIACWRARRDCVVPGPDGKLVLAADFQSAIERTIHIAETALADEQRIFFTGLQLPQVDPSVIAGTRTVIANLFKDSSAK